MFNNLTCNVQRGLKRPSPKKAPSCHPWVFERQKPTIKPIEPNRQVYTSTSGVVILTDTSVRRQGNQGQNNYTVRKEKEKQSQ